MSPEEEEPLTPRERYILYALLVSLSFSGGIGLLAYAFASMLFTEKLDQNWLLGGALLLLLSFCLRKSSPPS